MRAEIVAIRQKATGEMTDMKQKMITIRRETISMSVKQEVLKAELTDKIKIMKKAVITYLNEIRNEMSNMETRFKI